MEKGILKHSHSLTDPSTHSHSCEPQKDPGVQRIKCLTSDHSWLSDPGKYGVSIQFCLPKSGGSDST